MRLKGQKNFIKKCYNIKCEDYNEENENNCTWSDEVIYCQAYVSEAEFKEINEEIIFERRG